MKFFSINKNQAAVLTTLLILAFLGAGYFFIYLPHNERQLQEQRFQVLQNIDRNIHAKIENNIALLNNLLDEENKDSLNKYLKTYSSANFTFIVPEAVNLSRKRALKDSLPSDSTYSVMVNNNTREISLFFSKHRIIEKDTIVYKIGMKFSFKQFIETLLPNEAFNNYIVFSKGKPVYERNPAGISHVIDDSLLGVKNGFSSSGLRNHVISGIEYKLFLQPVGFDANNEWVIGGLLSNRRYQGEKTQLPTPVILLLITVMLIGLVAFPWLKLFQMGSKDRLTVLDGIASIFISMMLVSLVFFIFFKYNLSFQPNGNKDPKIILANGIDKAFKSEIDTAYHKLKQFDRLAVRNKDIINLGDTLMSFANGKDIGEKAKQINITAKDININFVFWVNKDGKEIINWTPQKINAPHGNFKVREYFKGIIEQRQYYLNDHKDSAYFLDQGISWTTGSFRSVISIKSALLGQDTLVVAALSFNLRSLDSVVLPTGYLFAITDNRGNVLYHSEPSRNLNENLFNVFSRPNELRSFLEAKAPGSFSTKYWGKEYEVKVKPVKGLPYFIIVLEDKVYDETRDMEIYSFTFSMLFLFFGFLVLQLFSIFFASSRRSFFKKQFFDTSWIGPKMSCQKEYVLASVFNIAVIFLLVLFFNSSSFLSYLFMLLSSVTLVSLFLNSSFARRYYKEKRSVFEFKKAAIYCLLGFFLIIEIIALKTLELRNFIYLLGYEVAVLFAGVGLYLVKAKIYGAAKGLQGSNSLKLLFGRWTYINSFVLMALTRLIITSGLPAIFFYIGSYNYEQNLAIRYKQIDFANRFVKKFPGVFSDTGNAKNEWYGVYRDSSVISSDTVISQGKVMQENCMEPDSDEALQTIELLKLFRLYITDKAVREDKFYNRSSNDSSFFFNHLLDEACTKGTGTITYRGASLPGKYLRLQSNDLNYQYPSVFKTNGLNAAIFWLLLVCMLFVFYFIICSIIKKLFSLNLPDLEKWKNFDNEILINKNWDRPLFVIGVPGSGKLKYLIKKIKDEKITLNDGTALYFEDNPEKDSNIFIADLINIPSSGNEETEKAEMGKWVKYLKKVFDEKNRMIIVNHFEYNIQDPVSNRFKLDFLERLYLEDRCKIVILSTIHPVAFLDSAMDPLWKQQAKPGKPAEEKSVPGQDLERWHVLLGHYGLVVLPLNLSSDETNKKMEWRVIDDKSEEGLADVAVMVMGTSVEAITEPGGRFSIPNQTMPFKIIVSKPGYDTQKIEIKDENTLAVIRLKPGISHSYRWAKLIRQETNHTYFLARLQEPAFNASGTMKEAEQIVKFDELVFKLQVTSHYFYMYIWQSLTKEEKFLLYDLAEDNLVNSFDDYNLTMLIAKGIVIRPDGTLKLFNKGFRNFILTAIGNSEAMKIKNQIKDNGNWNTLKNPLQLVVLAILAFLLISQEESFSKLITYAAALGAGLPTVLKLFGLFSKNSEKSA